MVYSYAEQVVANAQITNKKLRLFHFGVVSLAFGFLMPIAAIVGFLLLHLGGCL